MPKNYTQPSTSNGKGTIFTNIGDEVIKGKDNEVYHLENKRQKPRNPITSEDAHLENITTPHADPLVISPIISGYKVKRVLVDIGASVYILNYDAFKNMFLEEKDLKTRNHPFKGFGQTRIPVVGIISLSLGLGDGEHTTTKIIDFVVVRFTSGYKSNP